MNIITTQYNGPSVPGVEVRVHPGRVEFSRGTASIFVKQGSKDSDLDAELARLTEVKRHAENAARRELELARDTEEQLELLAEVAAALRGAL